MPRSWRGSIRAGPGPFPSVHRRRLSVEIVASSARCGAAGASAEISGLKVNSLSDPRTHLASRRPGPPQSPEDLGVRHAAPKSNDVVLVKPEHGAGSHSLWVTVEAQPGRDARNDSLHFKHVIDARNAGDRLGAIDDRRSLLWRNRATQRHPALSGDDFHVLRRK